MDDLEQAFNRNQSRGSENYNINKSVARGVDGLTDNNANRAPPGHQNAFGPPNDHEGHMMKWTDADSINYQNFCPSEDVPELSLINPRMEKFGLYTLSRQCKVSAAALKSLKDYTAQVRVFGDIPKVFRDEGYTHLKFWTQMSDSILAVSDMGTGDMQARWIEESQIICKYPQRL
jgi:hypothetical protein